MSAPFTLRIYWEDTDAGGVVYYANYLKFCERARTEALRAVGIGQQELKEKHGLAFVVRNITADFVKPALLDDLLTITTRMEEMGGASVTLSQRVLRNGETVFELTVRLGLVGPDFRPARMNETLQRALKNAF